MTLTVTGSIVGPPRTRVYPLTTEAQQWRVWPTFGGHRWERESPTSYVIRTEGFLGAEGWTLRLDP